MKMLQGSLLHTTFALLGALRFSNAQVQPPALEGAGASISARDRIYTGDQTSNTITVVNPADNLVLGTISLGQSRLGNNLNPQNVDSVNSHGLGFSRDGKYIVSLSTLSNTVTVIATKDNSIVSQSYVDRGPHEAFFAADNRTLWIGTRGVSSINIIDAMNGSMIERIATGDGPSKVLFSPDGNTAYVNHIREPTLSVIDVPSRTVKYNITGLADKFSSDMMISADGGILWAAHKMSGECSVIDLEQRKVISVLETGPETNHPNFAVVDGTTYGYITVAAMNMTRVYSQADPHTAPVHVKDIRMTGIQPHGMWPSADNTRMYVVNEHSDEVDVIDTRRMEIIDTFAVGQEGQALVYVSGAMEEGNDGMENLGKQGLGYRTESALLPVQAANAGEEEPEKEYDDGSYKPPYGYDDGSYKKDDNGWKRQELMPAPQALVTVRTTGGLDMFQVIGRNLVLNGTYTVSAMCKTCHEDRTPLLSFNASMPNPRGCGTAPQVLGFFKFFDAYDMSTLEVKEDA